MNDKSGLSCGHKFCNVCWDQYLTSKIMDHGLGETIPCAENECNIIVDDAFVMEKLTNPDSKLKYNRVIANNFVQVSKCLQIHRHLTKIVFPCV